MPVTTDSLVDNTTVDSLVDNTTVPNRIRVLQGQTPSKWNESTQEQGESSHSKKLRLSRGYTTALCLIHLTFPLVFVPWLFTWSGLVLLVVGNYVYSGLGISLCFHRALAHRALKLPKWLERTFATFGVCNLMETPARFVGTHRVHHQHSDCEGDPHSPRESWLQGHFLWVILKKRETHRPSLAEKHAKDILADPYYAKMEVGLRWLYVYLAHAALYVVAGFGYGAFLLDGGWSLGLQYAASWLLWGVFLRTLFVWHTIWAVNSVSHLRGYRNHPTRDNSRNHWFVALLTNGEGWHNNHHARPRSATFKHRWWEIDLTYLTIRFLECIGLAHDVKRPKSR